MTTKNEMMLILEEVRKRIVELRGLQVIIDADLARLYGVETKRINEAVRNNPEKFPEGYVFEVSADEKQQLVENFDQFNPLKHTQVMPKAFTEKGLYMLATILKSPRAVATTIGIIETFSKLRELHRTVGQLSAASDNGERKQLMQKSGQIVDDLFGDAFETTGTETEIELNFAVLKVRHTIKRGK